MGKMFVHYGGTVEAFKSIASQYDNKIVFIKGGENGKGAAIYTHGKYYANVLDLADLKFISSVKAGGVTATAQGHNGIIEFSSDDDTTVSVVADSTGIKIGLAADFVKQVDDATVAINNINEELAKKALDSDLTSVSNRIKAVEDDYLTSANETDIKNAVIGIATDASNADTIYGAKKYAEEKASAAENAAKAYVDGLVDGESGLESRVAVNEDAIEVLKGEGEGSVKKSVADAIAEVVAEAPENFDTLKEVADWIASDISGAAKMQNDIARLDGADTVEGSVKKQVKDAVAAAKEHADDAIAALDVTDAAVENQFVTAVSETDGKIAVSRSAINASQISITNTETDAFAAATVSVQDALIELASFWVWEEL